MYSLDDKKLMADYGIKFFPSKRHLAFVDQEDVEQKVLIKVRERRRKTYSAQKFQAYLKAKADNALKKAVKMKHAESVASANSSESSAESAESEYKNSSADA